MPSTVALILCIAFVLFLLWLDKKQAPEVSKALWLPTFWMLIVASKPVGTWCGQDPGDASPFDQVFFIGGAFLAIVILVRRKFSWNAVIRENKWLIFVLVFMFVSTFWTNNALISLKRWLRELIAFIMACVVLSESNPRQAMETILRRSTYVLIPFSLLVIKYFPFYGRGYDEWTGEVEWVGVALQKNGLGRICDISILFILWLLFRRWRGRNPSVWRFQIYVEILLLIIAGFLLKGPNLRMYSATGVSTLLAGIIIFIGFFIAKRLKSNLFSNIFPIIISFIIILGILIPFTGGSAVGGFTGTLGRNSTFTGRTLIWKALMPFVNQRPILGTGLSAFWTKEMSKAIYRVTEAHNGYLNIILQFGFLGLFVIINFYLLSCFKAQKVLKFDFDWAVIWMCYIVITLVHNITESSMHTFTYQLPAIVLFIAVSSSVRDISFKYNEGMII